jgi:hypothetical protein
MDGNTIVTHLAGFINPENMNDEWFSRWKEKAEKANDNGTDLVVFEIPKTKNGFTPDFTTIELIENFLQERFKS